MARTRNFKHTVFKRLEYEPAFANTLLVEAAALYFLGETVAARLILRDLVNGTIRFEQLALLTKKPSKNLRAMLSQNGNPGMDNLATIFAGLQSALEVRLQVHAAAIGGSQCCL